MNRKTYTILRVVNYIENNLTKKLNLDMIAQSVNYSKFHLHRTFTEILGISIHDYTQRRQLTEAAKLLIFTDMPILDIAIISGYESQQSFTNVFKYMYKTTPNNYRLLKNFYPLQLRYKSLESTPHKYSENELIQLIRYARYKDIDSWMGLVNNIIDGFPCFDFSTYREKLREYIHDNSALIMEKNDSAIGVLAFNRYNQSIDFFGVHPSYRNKDIAKHFIKKLFLEMSDLENISITTYREKDKADTGFRKRIIKLGFMESELLEEFGYPTQKFIISRNDIGK